MNIVTQIFAVFSAIGTWIGEAVTDLLPIFWSSTDGLTLLGTMSVVGLGMGVIFLMLGFITNFFQFRA